MHYPSTSSGSISSTTSVPCNIDKPGSGLELPAPQKRRVHFAPEPPQVMATIPRRSDMSKEEFEQLYWLPSEFLTIKTKAKLATREVMKRNKKGIDLINSVYSTAVSLANSLDDELLGILIKDPSDLAKSLHAWQTRDVGRGLEKYASTVHREERAKAAEESRCSVVSLSRNPHADSEVVASIYKEQARSAAFYARLVGEADAQATTIGNDDPSTLICRTPIPTIRSPKTSNDASQRDRRKVPSRTAVLARQLGRYYETRILPKSVPTAL